MEDEIDLGKYLNVLNRRWKLIVGLGVVGGVIALIISMLLPPTYEAAASVAIIQTRSDVTFNPNFVTQNDATTQASTQAAILDARRAALEALVVNGNVASEVIKQLGDQLAPQERDPAALLNQVEGHAVPKGDLIQITARSNSPERAALLANTWASAYEKQVNSVFSESPSTLASVQAQLVTAKADYDKAQAAYTQFVGEDHTGALNLQLNVVSQTLRTHLQMQSDVENQLLKQQVDSQQMLLDQTYQGLQDYFANSQEIETKKKLLSQTYDTRNRITLVRNDAQAMLEQAQAGGSPSASTLAQLLIKAQAFSSSTDLPSGLTLQIDAANVVSPNPAALQTDLEALVKTLDERLKQIQNDIDRLSAEVFKAPLSPDVTSAAEEVIKDLERRQAELDRLSTQSYQTVSAVNTPLSQTIENLTQEQLDIRRQIELQTAQERELKNARDLAWQSYSALLSKEAELQIANETASSQVRVAAEAVAPDQPVSPRKGLNAVLGAMLGLIVGVVAAFVIEARRVRSSQPDLDHPRAKQ